MEFRFNLSLKSVNYSSNFVWFNRIHNYFFCVDTFHPNRLLFIILVQIYIYFLADLFFFRIYRYYFFWLKSKKKIVYLMFMMFLIKKKRVLRIAFAATVVKFGGHFPGGSNFCSRPDWTQLNPLSETLPSLGIIGTNWSALMHGGFQGVSWSTKRVHMIVNRSLASPSCSSTSDRCSCTKRWKNHLYVWFFQCRHQLSRDAGTPLRDAI